MKIQFFNNTCVLVIDREIFISVRYDREKVDFFFPRGNIGDRIRANPFKNIFLLDRPRSLFKDKTSRVRSEMKKKGKKGKEGWK